MAQRKSKAFKFGAASAIIVLALAYLGWTGYSESKSYYVTIPELQKMGDQAYSRHLRVGGTVDRTAHAQVPRVGLVAHLLQLGDGDVITLALAVTGPTKVRQGQNDDGARRAKLEGFTL